MHRHLIFDIYQYKELINNSQLSNIQSALSNIQSAIRIRSNMKTFQKYIKYFILFPILFIQFSCEESTSDDASVGVLVGTWKLTALSGTYIWDAIEADSLRASWNYASIVMPAIGASPSDADQTLARYAVGDTLLNKYSYNDTGLPDTTYLRLGGIGMTGVFTKQSTYSLDGTYPSLRTDTTACTSYQADPPPQIHDQGNYGVVYNTANTGGVLTITAADVLPPFQDGEVTFTNDGNTVNIKFTDRDSHDTKCVNVGITTFDSDKRQTMGIAKAYINSTTGAFTSVPGDSLATGGYLMSDELSIWGGANYGGYGYMTWNALNYKGCLAHDALVGGDGTSCQSSHAAYLTDDSGSIFTTDCLADNNPSDCAGKLWYDINALCIGVNEVIIFDATFDRVSD